MFGCPTPLLRIFDLDAANAFYIDYLGFTRDWEHRFEPELPIYMQVSRGTCRLHLTQHHGDATPAGQIRVPAPVDALLAELKGKTYNFARPGIEDTAWGTREMTIWDPFGNRIRFFEE